ncbi:acyltransferase family protein [Ningiella sp. W23]|uniref:acyltransferase family protein n=1 Tax=Ningiella sp. W23 TaxID=3023715 RepID=UPI003756CB91
MNSRLYYLDSLRAILMLLGVVLHSAAPFTQSKYWLVSYSNSSLFLDYLNASIHSFRMPLFFMIAGFFSLMLIERMSSAQYLRNRVLRLLLPCVVVLFTFNMLQALVLTYFSQSYEGFDLENILSHWQGHFSISHLWFLINLFIYCCFLLPAAWLTHALFKDALARLSIYRHNKSLCLILGMLALPMLNTLVLAIGQAGLPIYETFFIVGMPYYLVYYSIFFFVGAWIFSFKDLLSIIEKQTYLWLTALLVTSAVLYFHPFDNNNIEKVVVSYLEALRILVLCLFIWSVFSRLVVQNNVILSKLSNASYTIYLLHHFFVVALVVLLIESGLSLPPIPAFLLIMTVVYVLTYVIHAKVINKSAAMTRLLNGK